MKYYLHIRVMAAGTYFDCWQQVEDGDVTGHVDDAGEPVKLPKVHESHVLTGQPYYAPGVLNAPEVPVNDAS